MTRRPYHRARASASRAILPIGLVLLLLVPGLAQEEELQLDNIPENDLKVAPLVIMENTDLTGRIIFMQEEDLDEEPGKNLDIAIITENKRDTIYETKTDDQGLYQIPRLKAGIYWMQVAQLRLRLRVNEMRTVDDGSGTNAVSEVDQIEKPKVLVIFIPRELG